MIRKLGGSTDSLVSPGLFRAPHSYSSSRARSRARRPGPSRRAATPAARRRRTPAFPQTAAAERLEQPRRAAESDGRRAGRESADRTSPRQSGGLHAARSKASAAPTRAISTSSGPTAPWPAPPGAHRRSARRWLCQVQPGSLPLARHRLRRSRPRRPRWRARRHRLLPAAAARSCCCFRRPRRLLGPALASLYGGGRPNVFLVTTGDNRTVVTRSIPQPAKWIGVRLAPGRVNPADSEWVDLEGVTRLDSHASVPNAGLNIYVGEDRPAALASVTRLRNRQLELIGGGAPSLLARGGADLPPGRRTDPALERSGPNGARQRRQPEPFPVSGPVEVQHAR